MKIGNAAKVMEMDPSDPYEHALLSFLRDVSRAEPPVQKLTDQEILEAARRASPQEAEHLKRLLQAIESLDQK